MRSWYGAVTAKTLSPGAAPANVAVALIAPLVIFEVGPSTKVAGKTGEMIIGEKDDPFVVPGAGGGSSV